MTIISLYTITGRCVAEARREGLSLHEGVELGCKWIQEIDHALGYHVDLTIEVEEVSC